VIEFYPQIKHAHIGLVMVSVALFALRGAAVQVGMRWPRSKPVRLASYAIDTGLLAAGLWLVAILPGGFFANGWLMAKLVLLVAYVPHRAGTVLRGRAGHVLNDLRHRPRPSSAGAAAGTAGLKPTVPTRILVGL
jgi:uncharacterized membrane protein SirB2